MEFVNAIKYGFKNYANFKGVVDRRTFWWWYLFAALVGIAVQLILSTINFVATGSPLNSYGEITSYDAVSALAGLLGILPLVVYLPTLALVVRRLRDVGTNPLFILFGLIPGFVLIIGAIVGGVVGASFGSGGMDSLATSLAGVFLGMLPGIVLSLGFTVWLIVLLAKPTKTAAQGNKYAVA